MADGFEKQVKERAKDVKNFFGKGLKIVGKYGKDGWNKLKNLRKCY